MINNQPCSPSHSAEPYILIMEYVSCGTLRTFLQTQRAHLISDPELQSLLTIASYHIALAVQHLHSKMVTLRGGIISTKSNKDNKSIFFSSFLQIVHCDLALRNIMVNKFPWEVKLGEFGLARDMTSMASRRSYRWKNPRVRHHAHIHTHMLSPAPLQMVLVMEDIFHFSVLN